MAECSAYAAMDKSSWGVCKEPLFKLFEGIRMNKRGPRCVLITYDEEGQQIETCTVDRDAVAALKDRALVVPWPLEARSFRLDDEFARRLGGTALFLLATTQPELKDFIAVTQESPPSD